MEEDIKLIENYMEYYSKDYVFRKAIENLIKRNKELEENKRLKYSIKKTSKIIDEYTNQTEKDTQKIIEYQKKYLQNENIQIAYGGRRYNTEGIVIKDYIPKSIIKARIEKLKVLAEKADDETLNACELDIRKNQIYLLQSLLQEGDK